MILLFCADSYAVTRKTVNHGQSKASVINGNGASFQTPNGEAGYYGREYVDQHTAGNRFTTNDSPGTSAKQKVTVKPQVNLNPKTVAGAAGNFFRNLPKGGAAGMAVGGAMQAMLGAIDAVIDPANNTIRVPSFAEPSTKPGDYYWYVGNFQSPSPKKACENYYSNKSSGWTYPIHSVEVVFINESQGFCKGLSYGTQYSDAVWRQGTGCSGTYNYSTGECLLSSGYRDATSSDFDLMEAWAAAKNSDFTRNLLKETCAGSPNPAACIDQLSEWGDMLGPSSAEGPKQTTTTTTKNPDGTTSTTTTTIQNRYDYTFGPNHYNYSTTTKITRNTDGVVTETETTDGLPTDTPTREEESTDYTFNDAEFPEVPSFYEQKYPDGLEGVWQQARADIDQSAFIQFLQGFVPSFSGSCPAFGLGFNIASWANYGNFQFSSICYVLDFVKIILLVTAIFTFRKVTFGG